MMHANSITFRGAISLSYWNRILRYLFDKGINYTCDNKFSPTRDDAGLPKYYDRVTFYTDRYIDFSVLTSKVYTKSTDKTL